jgi:hypothetical protein
VELTPQIKETHNRVEAKSMLTDEERVFFFFLINIC